MNWVEATLPVMEKKGTESDMASARAISRLMDPGPLDVKVAAGVWARR